MTGATLPEAVSHGHAVLDLIVSDDRFATYLAAAHGDRALARELYLWDRDVSVAVLSDIAILEVALRNAMHTALTESWGTRWFENAAFDLDDRSLGQLRRAWADLPRKVRADPGDDLTPGRLVSRLMFGFWANLLDAGGFAGSEPRRRTADYEANWRSGLHRAFPGAKGEALREGARFTRTWTHSVVRTVNALRNRSAHHEPMINGFPLPGTATRLTAREGHEACRKLARLLDRDLAVWLDASSRVPAMLADRPIQS